MSYTELQARVSKWMHRTDLSGEMDSFVELTESDINDELRVLGMETRVTITITDAFTDLPADYLDTRAMQVQANSNRIPLKLVSPDRLDVLYSQATGRVRGGSVHGGQLELRPAPTVDAPTDIEWSYFKKVPTLTANSTNDILDNYPLLYLSGMLLYANKFVQDDDQAAYWGNKFTKQMMSANKVSGRYHLPSVA